MKKKTLLGIMIFTFLFIIFICLIFFLENNHIVNEKLKTQKIEAGRIVSNEKVNGLSQNENYQKCVKSKNDMDLAKEKITPAYKETLSKQQNKMSLNQSELYTQFLYGYFTNRSRDYSGFIEDQTYTDELNHLSQYIYCPNIGNIKLSLPADSSTCIEIKSTWMQPFPEILPPNKSNYNLNEEYDLAISEYKKNIAFRKESIIKSCNNISSDSGSEFRTIKSFMK